MEKRILLEVVGPFRLQFQRQLSGPAKRIGEEHARAFWRDSRTHRIADKQGCYVFALRAGRGYTPWYVGKSGRSMKRECLALHKLTHYNRALFDGGKGTPVLFFIVAQGNRKAISYKIINEVEKYLIQTAVNENPKLLNKQNTKNLPRWGIFGVIRSEQGKSTKESRAFKKMMGL